MWRSLRGCPYSHASDEAAPDVLPSTGGGGGGESGRLRAALEEGDGGGSATDEDEVVRQAASLDASAVPEETSAAHEIPAAGTQGTRADKPGY